MTSAEVVQTEDEATVRIDRFAGAYAHIPPPRLVVVHTVETSRVMVSRQGVTDQDGVGLVGIELAVGFVDDFEVRQSDAALQVDWTETRGFGNRHADRLGRQGFHGCYLCFEDGATGRPRTASRTIPARDSAAATRLRETRSGETGRDRPSPATIGAPVRAPAHRYRAGGM